MSCGVLSRLMKYAINGALWANELAAWAVALVNAEAAVKLEKAMKPGSMKLCASINDYL
jgi:hypothetical protein